MKAYCCDKICYFINIDSNHHFNFIFRWQIGRPSPYERIAKGEGGGGGDGGRGPDPISCTNFKIIYDML